MHEDKNIVKLLYCDILSVPQLCKKRSNDVTLNSNIGFSTAYDYIAVAAYEQGMIGINIDRKKAAAHVETYFKSKEMVEARLPKSCFREDELLEILNTTKNVEKVLLPAFYTSEEGEQTMRGEFDKLKEGKYCSVDTVQVLKMHNFGWDEFNETRTIKPPG